MKSDKVKSKTSYGKKVLIATLTLVAAAVIINAVVFAKYYAQESRKSVITASGLYFSSNCLTGVDDVSNKEAFPSYVTSVVWDGTAVASLPIYIYNYDNILLYNDENLNITYDLHFLLMDNDENATYSVEYKKDGDTSATRTELVSGTELIITDLHLKGGSATSNMVTLLIQPKSVINPENYISKRVAVWAVPKYPDYVANSIKLAANIQLRPSKGEFTYSSGFTIEDELDASDWKSKINSMVGFEYKIKSTGDTKGKNYNYSISWNHKLLQIDKYNSYYIKAIDNNMVEVDNVKGITTMKTEAIPYSSIDISFYKTDSFSTDGFENKTDFTDTVKVVLEELQ